MKIKELIEDLHQRNDAIIQKYHAPHFKNHQRNKVQYKSANYVAQQTQTHDSVQLIDIEATKSTLPNNFPLRRINYIISTLQKKETQSQGQSSTDLPTPIHNKPSCSRKPQLCALQTIDAINSTSPPSNDSSFLMVKQSNKYRKHNNIKLPQILTDGNKLPTLPLSNPIKHNIVFFTNINPKTNLMRNKIPPINKIFSMLQKSFDDADLSPWKQME